MRMKLAALSLAAALAVASPAEAHYRGYGDPGPAIAFGMLGLALGAIAASQAPYYRPPVYPYPYYAPPIYGPYYSDGCAPGFIPTPEGCWPSEDF